MAQGWKTSGQGWKLTIFEVITWVCETFKCQKNGKKTTFNLAGNFAVMYSGKAITLSKLPNSTNIEDMDVGLFSNDATSSNQKKTSGIKAF